MNYPFEFKEMLLTDKALDVLGFSEYWAGAGDFGERRLNLGNAGAHYTIIEHDEKDDESDGYGPWPTTYSPCHFSADFKSPSGSIYFLHEMYEDIVATRTPEEVERFIEITKQRGINMYPFIKSYLEFKNK